MSTMKKKGLGRGLDQPKMAPPSQASLLAPYRPGNTSRAKKWIQALFKN
jgi:hypothetical protein